MITLFHPLMKYSMQFKDLIVIMIILFVSKCEVNAHIICMYMYFLSRLTKRGVSDGHRGEKLQDMS